jgi:hypothetical protein
VWRWIILTIKQWKMAIKIISKEMFTFDLAVHVGEIELHLFTGKEGLSNWNIYSKYIY